MKAFRMSAASQLAIIGLAIACVDPQPLSAQPQPPNVILIVADDLGWADLGCYGADLHETPQLDRLAREGVRFTCGYASAPVCTPTRAAIMTGKHPARLHMTIWREGVFNPPRASKLVPPTPEPNLPHADRTLAEALAEAGYLTAHVGKWHLGDAGGFPEAHGFQVHVGGNHWGAPATHFFPFRGQGPGEERYVPGLDWSKPGDYLADRLTDAAIDIVKRAQGRPFFLNLWHYGVHTPIEAKPDDVAYFEKKLTPELHHQNAKYAAMVRNLDENVGRLMTAVEEAGVADQTVIIFTSDNGGYVNPWGREPGRPVTNNHPLRSGKGSLYEGGLRVPFLVRWPGTTKPGSVCEHPIASADLYRTVQEIAGIEPKLDADQQVDGVSVVPLLKDSAAGLAREAMYWHYPHYYPTNTPSSSIRRGNLKLIEYYEGPRVELYDLKADPTESRDLAKSETGTVVELRSLLHDWIKQVDAQLPTESTKSSTD